jgi:hypothetical protein
MADIPTDTLPRLQTWWSTLEGGTQAIFEAIYLDAPGAVSRAVSGGAWEADGPEPGLSAQLGRDSGDSGAEDSIPMVTAADLPVLPPLIAVSEPVTVKWTEVNSSKTDLGAYVSDVYVQDLDGNQAGAERLQNDGLAAGASADRTWQFPGTPTAGHYYLTIWMNSEGSDAGSGVPGPQGFRSQVAVPFQVGNEEGYLRDQDDQAWQAAVIRFASAAADTGQAAETLTEGLNWLAASTLLTEDETPRIPPLIQKIAQIDFTESPSPRLPDVLASISGVAGQSQNGSDRDVRGRLLSTLEQLNTVY